MKFITVLFGLNAMLLLLHEIESAFEKEWELLKLPVKISGFLVLHVPIILVVLWGIIEIDKGTPIGNIIGIVMGIGGMIPFVVHKIIVRKPGHFELPISNLVILLNLLIGISLLCVSIQKIIKHI